MLVVGVNIQVYSQSKPHEVKNNKCDKVYNSCLVFLYLFPLGCYRQILGC